MLILIIIGTIIGAGFASGKEIYLFFYKFGMQGILGIFLCTILLGIVIYKTCDLILKNNIKNYDEFLSLIYKKESLKNINKNLINVFLLISFFIMIAGFGAFLEQNFNINYKIGVIIIAIICFIVFLKDLKGVSDINVILVPLLILFILYVGILNITNLKNIYLINCKIEKNNFYNNWFVQSIIYFSYNYILLMPIIVNFKEKINRKNILKIAIISSLIFFGLLMSVFIILNISTTEELKNIEMPAIYIVSQKSNILKNIYGIIIIFSIITTAISEGMAFIKNKNIKNKNIWKISMIMCFSGILVSNLGFEALIKILYPFIGITGILQIICICKK